MTPSHEIWLIPILTPFKPTEIPMCCKYTGSCCIAQEDYFYFHPRTAAMAQLPPSSCHSLLPEHYTRLFQPNKPCISL